MAILKSVLNLLEKNKIKYEVVKHRKVFTAWDLSQTKHIKPIQVVKTLVLKADSNFLLALIPASQNLDFNKVKKLLNSYLKKQKEKAVKKVSFTTEAWMKKNIAGNIGATPPFNFLLPNKKGERLPVIIDSKILSQTKVLINTGDYKEALKVSPSALTKTQEFIKGAIGKKK